MIVFVSPAKKLDEKPVSLNVPTTQCDFIDDAQVLLDVAQKLSKSDLMNMMKISDKLGELNKQRYSDMTFPFSNDNAKPAGFMFSGDTYTGLDIKTLSDDDLVYANDHMRILSGFYGMLRPLDLMQPYRLEMGIKIKNPEGEDLYDYWGTRLRDGMTTAVKKHNVPVLVNCASNEYSHALQLKSMDVPVITPVFKEIKNGVAKVVSFSAKRARGMMARYIIQNRIDNVDDLKKFKEAGYAYQADQSDATTFVFTRQSANQ